jgi:hypothetical protein
MLAAGRYEVPVELVVAVYVGLALIGVMVALWKARK